MQIKIVAEKDNPVMQRKELTVEIDFEGGATPKSQELTAAVAKLRGCDAALVEITRLDSSAGRAGGKANVKVWHNAEVRDKFKAHKRKKAAKKEGEAQAAPAPTKK
jgi:small subunit ribosomal protein S24e